MKSWKKGKFSTVTNGETGNTQSNVYKISYLAQDEQHLMSKVVFEI